MVSGRRHDPVRDETGSVGGDALGILADAEAGGGAIDHPDPEHRPVSVTGFIFCDGLVNKTFRAVRTVLFVRNLALLHDPDIGPLAAENGFPKNASGKRNSSIHPEQVEV